MSLVQRGERSQNRGGTSEKSHYIDSPRIAEIRRRGARHRSVLIGGRPSISAVENRLSKNILRESTFENRLSRLSSRRPCLHRAADPDRKVPPARPDPARRGLYRAQHRGGPGAAGMRVANTTGSRWAQPPRRARPSTWWGCPRPSPSGPNFAGSERCSGVSRGSGCGLAEPAYVAGVLRGLLPEARERYRERRVALVRGRVVPVVRRRTPGCLPDALHGVELGRARWQPVELDAIPTLGEPTLPCVIQPMTRPIVHHQKYLPSFEMLDK